MMKPKQSTVDCFIRSNGYQIAEQQGVTAAANASGLSRPTVYAILKEYPRQPKRTGPSDLEYWESSKGAKLFLQKNRNRIKTWKKAYRVGFFSWLALERKDPTTWTIEDYCRVWNYEKFIDSVTGKIRDFIAFSLRLWMKSLGKNDLLQLEEFSARGLKRPKSRKSWILEDKDTEKLIKTTKTHSLLLIEEIGLKSGGRISSILGIRPLDCNFEQNIISMYESKVEDYRARFFDQGCMSRVKQYIEDYSIAPDKPLFPSYTTVRKALKAVAKEASIPQLASMRGATHIFKHTFVTQGAFHDLSMESISEQTGTKPNTLQEFYVGVKERKLRHELLGEKLDILPFHEWVRTLEPLWSQQYSSIPVQKKTKSKHAGQTPKKRSINWTAIQKLTENPSTPVPLREYWLARLEKRSQEASS
jgi:site-specific recombinase XerD